MLKLNKAFTLVEIMVWIMIIAIVIVAGFSAYTRVVIWKINLIEKSNIQKDSFFFTEKLFQLIKEWWLIDYEEYFNRRVVWNNILDSTHFRAWTITNIAPWWHFRRQTGFWNFWRGWTIPALDYTNASPFPTTSSVFWNLFYYCISWIWVSNKMTSDWCVTWFNTNRPQIAWATRNINYTWFPQRYWQYSFQFIDYNSNASSNWWDENWNWNIVWDDDDEFLWAWPVAFNAWQDLKEIYLISWDKKTRTLIRWNVIPDEYAPDSAICQMSWWSITASSDWCRWTIEFLKLEWFDWWMDHIQWNNDSTENDWVIDTWIIDRQFTWWNIVVAWSNSTNYWQPLFPDSIHVREFKVFMYPNIDPINSWKSTEVSKNISPYLMLNFKIKPSWKSRIKLKNEWREINFSTTINLTDIYSK